jgi:hypothetical protein
MHDAGKFSLNPEVETIAHKDEYKQYNRLQTASANGFVSCNANTLMFQHLCPTALCSTIGPANIRTSASEFWGKRILQTWAVIPIKYLKRANS